jgi:hypothetical protein
MFRVEELSKGTVDSVSPGLIDISEMTLDIRSIKKKYICIIQLSNDTFKTMINTMKKLKMG